MAIMRSAGKPCCRAWTIRSLASAWPALLPGRDGDPAPVSDKRQVNLFLPLGGAESNHRATDWLLMTDLYTFGYEGLALDAFIARLKSAGVETVIDVRANPLSRKRGFSKNGLSVALEAAGISYNHIAAMGCPKPVRDRYKEDGNWTTYTRGFLSHLKKQGQALKDLANLAQQSTSCLVCFETDFDRCHRTFVARRAAELAGFKVKHLTIQKVIPDAAPRAAA